MYAIRSYYEEVDLLGEGGLQHLRRAVDDGAGGDVLDPGHRPGEVGDAGEEDVVERPLLVLVEEQVVDVRLRHLV